MIIKPSSVHADPAKALAAIVRVTQSLDIKIANCTPNFSFLKLEGIEESDRETFIKMCQENVQ